MQAGKKAEPKEYRQIAQARYQGGHRINPLRHCLRLGSRLGNIADGSEYKLVCAALLLLLATMLAQAMNNYLFLDYFKNARVLSVVNVVGMMTNPARLAPMLRKVEREALSFTSGLMTDAMEP